MKEARELDWSSPAKVARGWREFEGLVRGALQGNREVSDEMEAAIVARMRAHFFKLNSKLIGDDGLRFRATLRLRGTPAQGLRVTAAQQEGLRAATQQVAVKAITRALALALAEILDLEIQLYFAEH